VDAAEFLHGLVPATEGGVGAVAEQLHVQALAEELAGDGVGALGLGAGA
jgi:hypothetical protein